MKSKVYSFRAEPGFVPSGMTVGDYVKSMAKGGPVTSEMNWGGLVLSFVMGILIGIGVYRANQRRSYQENLQGEKKVGDISGKIKSAAQVFHGGSR